MNWEDYADEGFLIVADNEQEAKGIAMKNTDFICSPYEKPEIEDCTLIPDVKTDIKESKVLYKRFY